MAMKTCKLCGKEHCETDSTVKTKTVIIKELGIEVETECSQKDLLVRNVKIPKGWRLLTLSEFLVCYNKHRDKFIDLNSKTDELVQQPIEANKARFPYWNVWFGDLAGDSGLFGDVGGLGNGRLRGARYCRSLK